MRVNTKSVLRKKPVIQFTKFLLVGASGVVVNVVVFNFLLLTIFSSLTHAVIYASVVATLIAIGTNWVGSKYWSFKEANLQEDNPNKGYKFLVISLISLLIPLACVWLSHYVLGFDTIFADNIANNVVGLGIGTFFRFALYKVWVFKI